jgi:hypothetical protein
MFLYSAGALPHSDSLFKFFQRFNKADDAKRKQNGGWALKGWLYRVNKYNYSGGAAQSSNRIFKEVAIVVPLFAVSWWVENKF